MYLSPTVHIVMMLGKPSRCSSTFKLSGNTELQSIYVHIFSGIET